MTPQEAAQLLAVATKYDPRLSERTHADALLAAKAWAAAVYGKIPYSFAAGYVVEHYAASGANIRPRMSPSDVNHAWSRHIQRGNHEETLKAIRASDGIPATNEYLQARQRLGATA